MPLLREIIFGEDGLDRAGRLTRAAIDTFIGVDVKHLRRFERFLVLSRVDAIDGAHIYTSRVLCPYAGFSDNISHEKPKPPFSVMTTRNILIPDSSKLSPICL
jgi:hypothetical protein